jgi:short-subunit dehydrogenase
MFDFQGRTTLITGASSGIGEAFARALAARHSRLVLVARAENKLRRLAAELSAQHGVTVDVIAADLAQPGAAARLHAETGRRGLAIDVLVNNAGVGAHGRFDGIDVARQSAQIALNVTALVELTHAYLPELEARRGGVIQVASTAAFQPVGYMAVYAATKAFVLSFSEALWAETRGRGVRVLALCPGATESAFFDVAGEGAAFGKKASAADVVRTGLRAFDADRSFVVHGVGNFLVASSARLTPRGWLARFAARMMRPKPALPAGYAV